MPEKRSSASGGSPKSFPPQAAERRDLTTLHTSTPDERLNSPLDIERPRSALHAGDFTEDSPPLRKPGHQLLTTELKHSQAFHSHHALSSPANWQFEAFPEAPDAFDHRSVVGSSHSRHVAQFPARPLPVLPASYQSSFVFSLPTSPLAQPSTKADVDVSPNRESVNIPVGKSQTSRRHTLPPHTFVSLHSSPSELLPSVSPFERPSVLVRREARNPYQAHQVRRSLTTSLSFSQNISPSTPSHLQSRRPSVSSDVSPLHLASMVGSYEESILRGRMSTAPSKPLDFMAQIGVLGLGSCKSHLRCPAHVSVPFPAVFYSYGKANAGRASVEDGPSPYVGLIDLENSLGELVDQKDEKRRKSHFNRTSGQNSSQEEQEKTNCEPASKVSENDFRRRRKKRRRSRSPKAPPGGSYRIPQTGQLQIIIKNPNKTAVKLFLVPYDLQGMEPGTKTFIRQRSYSTGPIIEAPLRSRSNSETVRAGSGDATAPEPNDHPTLRYLIHLHMCCPSRGRFYLYKSIRVVFANRVPDGKEKLRNEIQLPEPRYSVYKPGRDSGMGTSLNVGPGMIAGNAFKRRSSGIVMGSGAYDAIDGLSQAGPYVCGSTAPIASPGFSASHIQDLLPSGLSASRSSQTDSARLGGSEMDVDRTRPNTSGEGHHHLGQSYDVSWPISWNATQLLESSSGPATHGSEDYVKLNKGEVGYGGKASNLPSTGGGRGTEFGHGLLARRFRWLDVERHLRGEP